MKKVIPVIIFLMFSFSAIHANVISGKVYDSEDDSPLRGVTVRVANSTIGTLTDTNGAYELKIPQDGKYKLIFSYLGYDKKTIEVELQSDFELSIKLAPQSLRTTELVVSANKRVQAVQEVPITLAVIEQDFILNQGYQSISEVMEFIPGVEVNQDNISIRGSSGFSFGVGSRTALLMDGFPMLAGDNGDVKTSALPFFNIERVEVVKGAGSALYGSSAMGGVINIITSDPKPEPELRARAYSGIYTPQTYEQWDWSDNVQYRSGGEASFSQKFGKTGFLLTGSYDYDASYRDFDVNDRRNVFAKITHDFSDRSKLEFNTNYSMTNADDWVYWNSLDSALIPPTQTNTDVRVESGKFAAFVNHEYIINDNNFLNSKLGTFSTFYDNTLPEDDPENRQSNAYTTTGEVQLNSKFGDQVLGTFGLFYQNSQVISETYGNHTQQIGAAYAQGELTLPWSIILTAGSRLDFEQASGLDWNTNLSPKFGFSYVVNDKLSLRASTGAGFRAPAIAERYSTLEFQGFEVIPNPQLKAERSWSYEIGGTYELRNSIIPLQFDLSVFQNDLFDLIEPSFSTTQVAAIEFVNLIRARIRGTEATIRALPFGLFTLQTSLTYMDPQDLDLNETLKYRSNWLWYTTAIIPYKFMEAQVDYRYKSRVENIDERLSVQIVDFDARDDIHAVNAMLKFKISEISNIPFDITINSRNLLNYYYTEVPGNIGQTRYVGLIFDYKLN